MCWVIYRWAILVVAIGLFGFFSFATFYVQMKKRDPEARYETKTGSASYQGLDLGAVIKKFSLIFALSMIVISVSGFIIASHFSPLPVHTQNETSP